MSPLIRTFDGPDCGLNGCQREAGHIGNHARYDPMTDPTAPLPDEELAAIEARDAASSVASYWQDRRVLLAALRAERAAPPDVERLARALDAHMADFIAEPESFDSSVLVAANVARHYAALAPATGEGAE